MDIESQADQESLDGLCLEGSARCARREFSFDCGENVLDERAQSIEMVGKVLTHFQAHSRCPATGAALGGYDAVGSEWLTAEGMVAFRIELDVNQHAADGRVPVCGGNQHR